MVVLVLGLARGPLHSAYTFGGAGAGCVTRIRLPSVDQVPVLFADHVPDEQVVANA